MLGMGMTLSAQTARVQLNLKQVSLKELFAELERKTPYRFSYQEGILDTSKKHHPERNQYRGRITPQAYPACAQAPA